MKRDVLVVGAGPVGLAGALELSRLGHSVRVVEKRSERSKQSKAIGINSRTLELLEEVGVTSRLLEAGVRLEGLRFGTATQTDFSIEFAWLRHRYPFMIGLPQSETEAIIEGLLLERGVAVERNVELIGLQRQGNGAVAELRGQAGRLESAEADFVMGADGAHSTVRRLVGIDFPGYELPGKWSLADAHLDTELDPRYAHVTLLGGRFVFMISFRPGVWRVASDRPEVLSHLPDSTQVKSVIWESDFTVSFRQASRYQLGPVCLCGDAAHVHSPLGARGMNMGIEDSVLLARALTKGGLRGFGEARHRATASAIRMVKAQTWIATHDQFIPRFLRSRVMPVIAGIPPLRSRIVARMAGFGYESED